jgi:sarcosine oxidase subunit beta
MKSFDVVIIGGGITGLSTAYYLNKMGVKNVLIIEKNYLGSGSTGRCGTGIRQQFTTKEHIVLMRESVKLWKEWENSLQHPIHFKQGGYLWLLRNNEELKQYKDYVKTQNLLGVQSQIISKEEVKEIVPEINIDDIVGASWCSTDGNAYPFEVIDALKFFVESKGTTIRTFEEVKSIKLKNGLIQSVITDKDIYYTSFLVNGAGAGAKKIAQMAGINLPVQNFRHQIAVSEPLEDFLNPMVVKGELYFTQTHRGRIIGGTDMEEGPSENLNSNINFLEKYAREVVDTLPTLSSVKIMRQWAGFYVVSPDHHPILGSQEIPNLILGCGYSGHGFMLGPIVGKLLAGYIKNGNFFLEEANHLTVERFKTGKLIHEKTVIG